MQQMEDMAPHNGEASTSINHPVCKKTVKLNNGMVITSSLSHPYPALRPNSSATRNRHFAEIEYGLLR